MRTDGAVTLYRGEPLWCYGGIEPVLVLRGALTETIPADQGCLFPAIAASGNAVLAGWQGHQDGQLRLFLLEPGVQSGILGSFGDAVNANPIAIRTRSDGFEVAVVRNAIRVDLLHVSANGLVTPVGSQPIGPTSQGITSWNGVTFTFGDPTTRMVGGRRVSEASPVAGASGWWIAQDNGHDKANRIVLVHEDGRAWQAYPSTVSQRPKAVRLPSGAVAVTASDDGPIALELFPPTFSDVTIGYPLQGPVDPPPPPPVDPMEPPVSYQPVPSQFATVEAVWNRCTSAQRKQHAFVSEQVAWELRAQGLDYYVNQKRGGPDDSEDAISTPHPQGAGGWAIIDVVKHFGETNPNNPQPGPAWIDQTQATIDGGTVGGGRLPRNLLGGSVPGPTDPPVPVPVAQHPAVKPILAVLQAQLAALAKIPACPPAADCPPCPLPHGVELPVQSEPELQQKVEEWRVAFNQGTRRSFPPSVVALQLYRLYHEGWTQDRLVVDSRQRGQEA